MADNAPPAPPKAARVGMPKSFGAKLSYMLGPLVLFLLLGVGISFVIAWVFNGQFQTKLEKQAKDSEKVQKALRNDLETANKQIETEKANVVKLNNELGELKKEKEDLAKDLQSAVGSLQVVSGTLQKTSTALDEFKETNKEKDQTQDNSIAENTREIAYLKKDLDNRFEKITTEMGQMKHVDVLLKGEYVALRNDLNTTMQRGNVTEAELNKLSERSKIFQLRVLTARAKEAEEAAREGDLKKLLTKLSEQ